MLPILLLVFTGTFAYAGGGSETSVLIDVDTMEKLIAKENPVILDIRDAASYSQGHIPGAMLLPLDGVDQNADRIAGFGRPIITYCSCPAEESSLSAAMIFQQAGAERVHVLIGGYRAWIRAGKRIVKGSDPL